MIVTDEWLIVDNRSSPVLSGQILRPPSKFIEVMGGNIEKELEASELKFYIPEMQQLDDGGGIGRFKLEPTIIWNGF